MSTIVNKIEAILTSEYSTTNFVELMREILNSMTIVAPNSFRQESSSFTTHIVGRSHIGNYITPEGKKIAIFAVKLKRENYVESSRSTQRSYVKKLIEGGNCEAAIVAFYTEGETKWRLSFVRLDYEMKIEQGKLKTTEHITPAKRYSFLVGKDEPSHTAIERFRRFFVNQKANPTLDELEEAFSVEKITKEFFELYCKKYNQIKEYLEKNEDFISESKRCGFTSERFAKKLMGQLVFLYFLQEKGWLGVKVWPEELSEQEYIELFKDDTDSSRGELISNYLNKVYLRNDNQKYTLNMDAVKEIPDEVATIIVNSFTSRYSWGEGSKTFLRDKFDYAVQAGDSFYEDILEPLFYKALNQNRGDMSYCAELHTKIPFLGSELFEPMGNYDWENTHFDIPNDIFSNKRSSNDYTADGILDIFDQYNFTVSEEEPMEKDIAIDPEMMGKVFENLLEVENRKAMGAYYSPREIVRYMCLESLINFISKRTNVEESIIRDFVLYGDAIKEADLDKLDKKDNSLLSIPDTLFQFGNDGVVHVNRLIDIDDALASVCIIDPATGSGAFPLGMVNEIVRLRQIITFYCEIGMNEDTRSVYRDMRTSYWLKHHAIKNCIYAVDNEPSAVDVTKLRLWLSLIIDSKVSSNNRILFGDCNKPLPLPTLEKNIQCSNSLICSCGQISPFAEGGIIKNNNTFVQSKMKKIGINNIFDKLHDEKEKLFECYDLHKKKEIKVNIQACKNTIIKCQKENNEEEISLYNLQMDKSSKPFTIWQLDFSEVFLNNGGFDIVICSPPFVQLSKSIYPKASNKIGDQYASLGYSTYSKTGDLYCLFYELGISLLKEGGCLAFLSSNKWMRTDYGKSLRSYFVNKTNPRILIDFSGTKMFESAVVDVNVLLLEKSINKKQTMACSVKRVDGSNLFDYIKRCTVKMSFTNDEVWEFMSSIDEGIKKKILSVGKPISQWDINIKYGIKTGLNKAFVINETVKKQLCDEDDKSIQIIKPLLRGRDVGKWNFNYNNLWLIVVHNGVTSRRCPPINIDDYPAIKRHLSKYYTDLCGRVDKGSTPYNLRDCAYLDDFSSPKIIFQEMVQSSQFTFDSEGKYMCLDTARIITGKNIEYLTALFNSDLFFFAVKHFFGGGKLGEKGVRMKHTFFQQFSAYEPTIEEEQYIKNIVLNHIDDRDKLINDFFYKKYGITSDEISHIEQDIR